MLKIRTLWVSLLLPAMLSAAVVEKKLQIMENMATRFQKNCPEHVKVSAKQDTLTISFAAAGREGGFDNTHAISLKPLAGRSVTFIFDIKLDNLENPDGTPVHSVGKFTVGGTTKHLLAKQSGWHTCVFKSVKIPGSGMLKMRIVIKNMSGEIQIRNMRARVDVPKWHGSGNSSKKKNKNKKKNEKND